jgi:hypothetical protein
MTKDEICGLLRQIHDVLAIQSETNQVKSTSDYERGVIDGMLKQAESSVDKAVNEMSQRTWVGLELSDMPSGENPMFDHEYFIAGMVYADKVLKEKNT